VSQTWSEIHKVNEAVRALLQARGLIGGNEHAVVSLERVDLTNAQKLEGRFYTANTVLVFNRDCGRFRKGDTAQMVAMTDTGIFVEAEQKIGTIATRQLDHVTVCRKREMVLVPGDRLQLKANGQASDGRRVANGELVTVDRVESDGRILLRDGRALGSDYRQFMRGYAVTSYASQGKTVDYVLFSDSAVKAATNRQQWYVTISRGRRGIKIFTSDPRQLRESAARSGDRELALDLRQHASARQVARWRLLRGIVRGRRRAVELWRGSKRIMTRRTTGVGRRVGMAQ
jgi:ATP-dependent exoDNAse (exonuclease V) alpha subunit